MPQTFPDTSPALACVASAIPADDRPAHFVLLTRLFSVDARARRELADGYAYRFDAGAWEDIARWIAHERRCCPFLRFTIEVSPSAGAIWLHLTGPLGVHAFLDAELPASGAA